MSTVLDDILTDVATLESDAAEQFENLARQIHAGEKPTASTVLAVLRAAEKTRDDLSAFVRLLERRAALRENIAEVQRLHEENTRLRAEIDQHNAELEAAVARHQAACHPLQNQIADNNSRLPALSGAETELFQSCQCDDLRFQFNDNKRRQDEVRQRINKAEDSLHRAKSEINGHNWRAFPAERERIDAWIKRATDAVSTGHTELAELQQQAVTIAEAMRQW